MGYTAGEIPFQGVGQGNGMGPCIWAALSSVLFDAMRHSGFGAKVVSPISGTELALMGGAFVDDLDLFSMSDPWLSPEADVDKMQSGLDLWRNCSGRPAVLLNLPRVNGTVSISHGRMVSLRCDPMSLGNQF